ncbi:MAG: hypothetical protein JNK82_03935, partial [Myxococcaceae bacterium]|nr:hypothetical protein [Myxococcaceae bacterium]
FRHQADAEKYGNLPDWATVEELAWSYPNPPPREQEPWCRFVGPAMKGLKRAQDPWVPSLVEPGQPWAIEALTIPGNTQDLRLIAEEAHRFPKLQALRTRTGGDVLKGFVPPPTVKTLRVSLRNVRVDHLEAASAMNIETLELGEGVVLERGADGTLSKLSVRHADTNPMLLSELAKMLPQGLIESVTFERATATPRHAEVEPALQAKVRKAGEASPLPKAGTDLSGPKPLPKQLVTTALLALPGGEVLLVTNNHGMLWVDPEKGQVVRELPQTPYTKAALLPNGQVLAFAYKKITWIDPTDGRELEQLPTAEMNAAGMVRGNDERYVSLGRFVLDLEKREVIDAPRGASLAALVSPDRTWWVRSLDYQEGFRLFNDANKKGVVLEHAKAFHVPMVLGDVLVMRTHDRLAAWSTTDGRLLRSLELPGERVPVVVALSNDRRRIAVATSREELKVLDAETFAVVTTIVWPDAWSQAAAFSADRRKLFVAGPNLVKGFDIG